MNEPLTNKRTLDLKWHNGVQSTRPQGSRKKQTRDIPLTSAVSGLTNWLPLVFLGTLQLLLWKTDGSVVKWWILYCQVVVKLGLSDVFSWQGCDSHGRQFEMSAFSASKTCVTPYWHQNWWIHGVRKWCCGVFAGHISLYTSFLFLDTLSFLGIRHNQWS